MSSVLGVSVGAGAIRLARPPAGAAPGAEPESFELRTFVVPPETPSAERAALSVAAALNSNPAITGTVLACRDEQQARALHAALTDHGLHDYELVPDIDAVLEFAVASGALKDVTTLAIYDLGSSGLSVTVVDVPSRKVQHTERTGDISGEYFDSLIREQQINSGRIAHPPDPSGLAELDALCRAAKERLSGSAAVALPSSYGPVLLTQENFTALIARSVETSARATRDVIGRSGRAAQALLAVGGGVRIPLVSRSLRDTLEIPVLVPPEPETATARGAALLARKALTRQPAEEPAQTTASAPLSEPHQQAPAEPASAHPGAPAPQPGTTTPATTPLGRVPAPPGPVPAHSGTAPPLDSTASNTTYPGPVPTQPSTTAADTARLGSVPTQPSTTAADTVHPDSVPASASPGGTSPQPGTTPARSADFGPYPEHPGTTSAQQFATSPTQQGTSHAHPGSNTGPANPGSVPAYPGAAMTPSGATVSYSGMAVTQPGTSGSTGITASARQNGTASSRPDLPIPQPGIFGPPAGTAPMPPSARPPASGHGTASAGPDRASSGAGPGPNSNPAESSPALPHPISTPVPRLSPEEDPPTVALRLPAKLLPRRSFGEPPQRRNREISAAVVAVSALVVVAAIGIGLGYGQQMFSQDSATAESTSHPQPTTAAIPSTTPGTAGATTSTTPPEHAPLAEPPPVFEPEPEPPPVTTGPNTVQVPGLPPIVVPTIPPEALPFPRPAR
ncbi:Hsp70 family protein [Nocardia sp. NPDC051750]|uniref:Hsp70 family protein n=1 Tax=Nocardia sp. NPDC051750 TaxID=3364325 RepID=UPI003795D3C8